MDRIVVYDVPDEGKKCTSRDFWVFLYFEHRGLILDAYVHEERDNLRQKFRPRRAYLRLQVSRGEYDVERIEEDKAPLPGWVCDRARELFMHALKVEKWKR